MENRCCDAAGTDDCYCEESRWMHATNGLPKEGVDVLWFDPADSVSPFLLAKRNGQSLDWGGDLSMPIDGWVYWMPIPSPPVKSMARNRK